MNYVLIPCTSSAPDREHDAVVLNVDDALLAALSHRRDVFAAQSADTDLHAHEYQRGPIHYLNVDDGEYLDAPEGPVSLTEHLEALELFGSWQLEAAPHVYLSVVAEGFFYTWDGRTKKHGPSELYETDVFTVEQLEGLSRAVVQRA